MSRLVATDLDGTLLHTDGTVTDRTRGVLDALDAQGVTVVFVTGRPIRWMEPLWHHVGDHGLAICSNGGIVYDVPGRSVIEARTIPRDVGLTVAELVRRAAPGSLFSLEKTTGFGKEPSFLPSEDDAQRPELEIGPLAEIFDDTVVKMLALHLEEEPERYWAQVEKVVGHAVTTTWSSVGALVEMSAAGVTKASTLELICAERGIDAHDVVAFGDMPNDVAMLEWAGTSYAMGNAHPLAVAAADHVAPRNDEDGVAAVLERLFLS
ncbi:MAG TPA: HAD family hydrolase [Marmoricola sp.]|nr:HAD family hydrolase [Marmoricola sp.]